MKRTSAILNHVWFRTALVVTASVFALAGITQAATTLNADITTDGDLDVAGSGEFGTGAVSDSFSVDVNGANFYTNSYFSVVADADDIQFTPYAGDFTVNVAGDGAYNAYIKVGDAAPDAGEDGNDIALEAEDSLLVETTGLVDYDVGGDFLVSADYFGLTANDAGVGFDLQSASGSLNVDTANITLESEGLASFRTVNGNIRIYTLDSSDFDDDSVVLTAGPSAPDASEDGNDVALEAEDDVLIQSGDVVRITANSGNDFITLLGSEINVGGELRRTTSGGVTAFATGGQASATQINSDYSDVTTVASNGDSVKLPVAAGGQTITITNNDDAESMDVFPSSGDSINDLSANTAVSVASNTTLMCFSKTASGGDWECVTLSR